MVAVGAEIDNRDAMHTLYIVYRSCLSLLVSSSSLFLCSSLLVKVFVPSYSPRNPYTSIAPPFFFLA
jgi:hypothetical protein